MGRSRDSGLEAVRSLVREAYLDTGAEFAEDPAVFQAHPTELEFASYMDRLLSDSEEAEFERHVAMCSTCAEELVLCTRVAEGERRREQSSYWKMAAGVALAMGGLIAALMAGQTVGNKFEETVLAGLEESFGGRAKANAVSISLLRGPEVELDGFQVDDPEGGDPLMVAGSARMSVDLAALRQGELGGDLELDRPVFNVVRNASGQVNIDSLLPSSARLEGLLAKAVRGSVRSVKVNDGTIRIVDEADGAPREVRMANVDAELTGLSERQPAKLRARAGLESAQHNLALAGTVGPWGGGAPPTYRFREFDLDAVPLRAFATVRDALRGGLSYEGTLRTAGSGWAQIASNVSGAGALEVVSGAVVGKNVIAETVRPWVGSGEAPTHLAALLATADTPFDEIRSTVALRQSSVSARDLEAYGPGFAVEGEGALESTGVVDFDGVLVLASEISAELVALAPVAGRLLNDRRELTIPFRVAGKWPDVQPHIDFEAVAGIAYPMPRLALLLFRPAAG